jgi:hypothetical protein
MPHGSTSIGSILEKKEEKSSVSLVESVYDE